ncbi:hypothetical protein BDZ94DRAFT_1228116, partial [Collybia nuda]
MAIMTLPLALPGTPSSTSLSPTSDDPAATAKSAVSPSSNGVPRTPVSPTMPSLGGQNNNNSNNGNNNNNNQNTNQNQNANQNQNQNNQNQNSNGQQQPSPNSNAAGAAAAQLKRKPSRRANTAERRATHNAVERQRRETLNGRFLDLAALLPNLSQIRRPSKSSIVNSSIAHVHASRRHRLLAARELRLLKLEADALRREVNEWRERAGIPGVGEPVRGDGFGMVLGGELEVIVGTGGGEEEDDEDGEGLSAGGGGGGQPA